MRRTVGRALSALLVLTTVGSADAQTCGDGAMSGGETCDDGNTVGGDGCAANCTLERVVTCTLAQESSATVKTVSFTLPSALAGQLVLAVGDRREDRPAEPVPFVIPAAHAHLAPSMVPGLGLSCTVLGEIPGWGPGNAGGGLIDCGTARLDGIDAIVSVDASAADPTPATVRSGTGPVGSSAFELGVSSYALIDAAPSCVASPGTGPPSFGPDAIPCTGDDVPPVAAVAYPGTTGVAKVRVLNANGGSTLIEANGSGRPLACAQLANGMVLSGTTLVAAGAALDRPQLGDAGVVVTLVCEPTADVPTPTPRIIRTCVPTPTPTSTPGGDTPTAMPTGTALSTATAPATATAPIATVTVASTLPPATLTATAVAPTPTVTTGALATATAPATAPPATVTVSPPAPTGTAQVAACVGDCNGDRTVGIDELIRGVNIALGSTALDQCVSLDANGDGSAGIEELIRAVNNALQGCPS
ncbi:hypothetical protein KF840_12995 [bacterium]|nr:hypothetical protein [bacterium]